MPRTRSPRRGSMQFWPRKRAKSMLARIRCWAKTKDTKPLCFAGYKVGMTHMIITDNRPNAITKGEDISWPVTIIECPPIKVAGIVFYRQTLYGPCTSSLILAEKLDKELGRTMPLPKKQKKIEEIKPEDYSEIMLLVHTQPKLTGIGKKKPELFELAIGGEHLAAQLEYAKKVLGKEISLTDVFVEGQQTDIHTITKGKGYQGPVKRFGVAIRSHKSEKTKRGPGNIGPWHGTDYNRVAHAGQMGFHQRTDYNKIILKISDKTEEINAKGGFIRYGVIKNKYLLVKGSISGPPKRLIKITMAVRPNKKIFTHAPAIVYISQEAKQ